MKKSVFQSYESHKNSICFLKKLRKDPHFIERKIEQQIRIFFKKFTFHHITSVGDVTT